MRISRTKLRLRLPIAIMNRDLRALRWRSLEGVAFCVKSFGAGVGDRDFNLLPFDRATAARVRASRAAVVAAVMDATAATMYS